MTFSEDLASTPVREGAAYSLQATDVDVTRALARSAGERDLWDFAALLSPAASAQLEEVAQAANRLTVRRFGKTVHMYAPIYLSNECLTTCTYCGFAKDLDIVRRTLSVAEAVREAKALTNRGFRHLLLLTGEHQKITGVEYLEQVIRAMARVVPQLSIEVQVWSEDEYRRLAAAGCDGVVIYQETYDRDAYRDYHVAGKKRDYDWRLAGPERAGRAGIRRLGVGALLGLHDPWREEAIATAAHARFLMKRFWRSEVSVSLPRIRPSASGYVPRSEVSDRDLAQLVCAFRLLLPDIAIVGSSREAAGFRDALVPLGITHTSAGSHTEPGGYTEPGEAEGQFEVNDTRSPEEVAAALTVRGFDVVWKDWDPAMREDALTR
ncbi:MAG: 2-iminoacetate synthase ThiH [Actinomycetota bacterium]